MSTKEVLREKHDQLAEQYEANASTVRSLRRTLQEDILPALVDELVLDDAGEERAKVWLNDTRTSRLVAASSLLKPTGLFSRFRLDIQAVESAYVQSDSVQMLMTEITTRSVTNSPCPLPSRTHATSWCGGQP